MIASWSAPCPDGTHSDELLLQFDQDRSLRVLIIPALFDEANKLRRFTVSLMRQLNEAGIDSFLPDLPGCNESAEPLSEQSLSAWRTAIASAQETTQATHILAIRAGALLAPADLPGWLYAPIAGAKQLRGMIRARTIAAREDGRAENSQDLLDTGLTDGLLLSGWDLGATMIQELQASDISAAEHHSEIAQSDLGGPGLWLRAEPDDAPDQSAALAAIIQSSLVAA